MCIKSLIVSSTHSDKSYWIEHSCGSSVCYPVQVETVDQILQCDCSFKWKLLCSTFLWCCLLSYIKVVLTFQSLDDILNCDIQMEGIENYFFLLGLGWPMMYYHFTNTLLLLFACFALNNYLLTHLFFKCLLKFFLLSWIYKQEKLNNKIEQHFGVVTWCNFQL